MKKQIGSLAAIVALVTPTLAHADDRSDDWSGVGTGLAVLGAIELTAPAMLVADGVAHPSSPVYGGVELAVGGLSASLNTYLAYDMLATPCDGCSDLAPWFIGFAVLDVVSAVHGGYVIAHQGKREAVTLVPTVVKQGHTSLPGVALGGSF